MQEKIWSAKRLTVTALAMAVVCVSTMAIQIPIPLGYMHLGNCCILLISVYSDTITSTLAGAAQITGLATEGILGMILFYIVAFAVERGKASRIQQ